MEKILQNTLVSISLTMEDKSGQLLDESEEIMYLHGGYGQIFPKLEAALEGKTVGDSFQLSLTPKEAFGEYDTALVVQEPLAGLPEDIALGMELEGEDETQVWIVETIQDGVATLNANHELAGIPLRISGEVLELEQLTEEAAQEVLENDDHHH